MVYGNHSRILFKFFPEPYIADTHLNSHGPGSDKSYLTVLQLNTEVSNANERSTIAVFNFFLMIFITKTSPYNEDPLTTFI